MEYQFIACAIVLGISVLTNCLYCYKSCKRKSKQDAAKKREKIQELAQIATKSDLPTWVVNEYLTTTSKSFQV